MPNPSRYYRLQSSCEKLEHKLHASKNSKPIRDYTGYLAKVKDRAAAWASVIKDQGQDSHGEGMNGEPVYH